MLTRQRFTVFERFKRSLLFKEDEEERRGVSTVLFVGIGSPDRPRVSVGASTPRWAIPALTRMWRSIREHRFSRHKDQLVNKTHEYLAMEDSCWKEGTVPHGTDEAERRYQAKLDARQRTAPILPADRKEWGQAYETPKCIPIACCFQCSILFGYNELNKPYANRDDEKKATLECEVNPVIPWRCAEAVACVKSLAGQM